jgi:hypothetical protein
VRNLLLFILFLFVWNLLESQCIPENFSFSAGETVNYDVYYNWGFLWVNAGYVQFRVKEKEFRKRKVYHLESYGNTYKSYDWIFKVRDYYQSYVDVETFEPLWFYQQNSEGGYEANNKYFFDQKKNKAYIYTQNSERPFKKDTLHVPECTYDVLSLIYFARNIDFSGLGIGDSVPVKALLDTSVYDLYIRYLGKEVCKSKDGKKYNCIKFAALLVEGTMFKGGEDLIAWVTDDRNRIPVLVEAKILVGSVKAYVKNIEGNRNPINSLIKN